MRDLNLCHYFFAESVRMNMLCKVQLKEKDIEALKHAIEELYYYEFIIGRYIFQISIFYFNF